MLKNINNQNIINTPFIAEKEWELYNVDNNDVIVTEANTSQGGFEPIAFEYIGYTVDTSALNRNCNIALEQQTEDEVLFEEGVFDNTRFYPEVAEKNFNGTYKKLVYNQVKNLFYNNLNDPTKVYGVEYIDFQLSRTTRYLANSFKLLSIPQRIFGDKIVENSVTLYDYSIDDNLIINDDGYQNLIAGNNIFSKVQEVRSFENDIQSGNSSYICS